MSDDERKELNLKAGRLIKSRGIYMDVTENKFDELQEKSNAVGYAHYYLGHCYDKSELINKADIKIYKELLEIGEKLGTTQTKQLFGCVAHSLRMDLIKVTESSIFYFKIQIIIGDKNEGS